MENYQTPIRKKKTRILGLTLSQIGLLAGMLLVQLVILVLALKYIVFAPPIDIPVASQVRASDFFPTPTLAPTPVPDFTTAVLTIDDLPPGFVSIEEDEAAQDFGAVFDEMKLQPVNEFYLFEVQKDQFVTGWTFVFDTPAERENFDILVAHPGSLLEGDNRFSADVEVTEGKLEKPIPIGELSTGWKAVAKGTDLDVRVDIVLFSDKNFGGIVMLIYDNTQPPVLGAWEVAQKLDNRILDVQVNGPIPTPVVIAFDDLAGVKLTQADLPQGFVAVPDSDLVLDAASAAEIEQGGMRVAGVFGLTKNERNAEEFVLGYTFLFSNTVGKAVMDQLLASDDLMNAMFAPTPTQRRVPLTLSKSIGDRAISTAIMEMTEQGGVRCDVLVFRRGHVGVVLFHIYLPGRRQVTVEDLALKLDAQLLSLPSP